jgi:hypothetical protein
MMFPSRANPLGRDWSELDELARKAVIAERQSDLDRMQYALDKSSVDPRSSVEESYTGMTPLIQARQELMDQVTKFLRCPLDGHVEDLSLCIPRYRMEWIKAHQDS